MMEISQMKYDILKEVFNIGVGKSASMLSEIVNKRIVLNVPHLEMLGYGNGPTTPIPNVISKGTLVVSTICFKEKLAGEANLIFPADKMRQFLNLCQGEEPDYCLLNSQFDDIDLDIIKEVGNIVLNSIVGELGNFLNLELYYSLPKVTLLGQLDFAANLRDKDYLYRLMLYITFLIDGTEINGAIIMDMTINSVQELINNLEKMEVDLYE